MGSLTSSMVVDGSSSVNQRNWSSAISLIMSVDGIMTGGGVVASLSSTTVLELVGDEMRALDASSARMALR